jgi:archaellum component FlaF (FlaF/FlaG flagellin family)
MTSLVSTPPLDSYFQVRNKVPTGQYVQPKNTKFDITVYGQGSFLFTIHDLNAITVGAQVEEGEQCMFAKYFTSPGVMQFQSTEYILPVLSNPKRTHTILFCLWNTEQDTTDSFLISQLKDRYRLARVGTFVTAYDASTSALYKQVGKHEPVLGHRIVESQKRSPYLQMPTRMQLQAPIESKRMDPVDVYTSKIKEIREREGIVVERSRKTKSRYEYA